jgi:predicted protein tyrosine phosphatase
MKWVQHSPFPRDGLLMQGYGGLKLEVMSQAQARKYTPINNEVCISIRAYPGGVLDSNVVELSDQFADVLSLQFDDNPDDHNLLPGMVDVIPMTAQQADDIAQFVLKHRDNKQKIVIHCFAGISRSRSTAAAIADVLELPYSFTVKNTHVYNLVSEALRLAIGFRKLAGS